MITYNGSVVTGASGAWVNPPDESYVRVQFSDVSHVPTKAEAPGFSDIDFGWEWKPVNRSAGIWDCFRPNYLGQAINHIFHLTTELLGAGNTCSIITTKFGPLYNGIGFCNNTALVSVQEYNAKNIKSMQGVFDGCTSLTSANISNTDSVTNLSQVFMGCSSLSSVSIGNTASVTTTSAMFAGASSLVSAPSMNMGSVVHAKSMFAMCSSLVNVPQYDWHSLQYAGIEYGAYSSYGMFGGCTSMQYFPDMDIDALLDAECMFYGDTSLLSTPDIDLSSAYSTHNMYAVCRSIVSANNYDLSSATDISGMFAACSSLKTVPRLTFATEINNSNQLFGYCTAVESGTLDSYNSIVQSTVLQHGSTYYQCGSGTVPGAYELSQIPASWGGTGP